MAISVDATVLGGVTSGDSSLLGSWTPASNDLILVFVAQREEDITIVSVVGNGITFTEIFNIDNVQSQGGLSVFRGMDSSPTTGQITVTHTGATLPTSCAAIRMSGIDTSGTNGSGAIGNTNSDTGPDPDDDDMVISVTITADDMAVFSGWHRGQTLSDPPASDDVTISINNAVGTGGSTTHCSVWQDTGSGSVQGGEAANLTGVIDHVETALQVKAAAGGPTPMGRMYNVSAAVAGVTAAIDLLRISAPSDAIVVVHKVTVTQETEFGDAASEQMDIQFHRGSTDGSGGSAATVAPLEVGDAVFGGTAVAGNTTQSTEGTILLREAAPVQAGFYWAATPEERIVLSPSGRLVVELPTAPDDSIDFRVTATIEEIGG